MHYSLSEGSCTTKGHSMDVLMLLHQSYSGSNSLSNKLQWTPLVETKACRHLERCHRSRTQQEGALLQTQAGPTSQAVMDLCVLLRSDTLKWPVWNHFYFEIAQSKATTAHENVKCMLVIGCIIDFAKSHLLVTLSKLIDGGRRNNSNKNPSILLDPLNYLNCYLKITLWFYLLSLLEESWKKPQRG